MTTKKVSSDFQEPKSDFQEPKNDFEEGISDFVRDKSGLISTGVVLLEYKRAFKEDQSGRPEFFALVAHVAALPLCTLHSALCILLSAFCILLSFCRFMRLVAIVSEQ
ncbi:MAG: hypothetical protein FWH27_16775 [Planctomycetaceae bacterium]|nr:hypothetical protein [Planctomycetaceae bacterium]